MPIIPLAVAVTARVEVDTDLDDLDGVDDNPEDDDELDDDFRAMLGLVLELRLARL
jgi:hypothetical protein